MIDLSLLTEPILQILCEELIVLINHKIYSTYEHFLTNIERFANFCVQDTHPEMYNLNYFIGDDELNSYMESLRYYAINGGFRRE